MPDKNKYITLISKASNRYGNPYLTGFMEEYNLNCLSEATAEQAEEYYNKYIGELKNEISSTKKSG